MFSVINGVLLHPVHHKDPSRLVVLMNENLKQNLKQWPVSELDFAGWRAQNHVFEQLSACEEQDLNIASGMEPERVDAASVSAHFFELLGDRPALGRTFLADEEQKGREHVAVISNGVRKRRFGVVPDAGCIDRDLHPRAPGCPAWIPSSRCVRNDNDKYRSVFKIESSI